MTLGNGRRRARRAAGACAVAVVLATPLGCRSKPKVPADVQVLLSHLVKEQRAASAGRVRAQCEGAAADACACVQTSAREALDDALVDIAKNLVAQGKTACPEPLSGQAAEVEARAGTKGAADQARAVLAAHADDPYATYALAHLAWMSGDRPSASKWAEAAVSAGRESPAHLVVGILALNRGDLEVARGAFLRVLDREPADAAALYNTALCDHRLNHYRAAREGYLSVLRKNPRHLDARYNLVLLTLNAGFRDEATHHLSELERISPGDPRIAPLEAQLKAAAAAPPAASVVVPVPSAAPPAPSASAVSRPR